MGYWEDGNVIYGTGRSHRPIFTCNSQTTGPQQKSEPFHCQQRWNIERVHRWSRLFDLQTHFYRTRRPTSRGRRRRSTVFLFTSRWSSLLPSNIVIDINMSVTSRTRSSRNSRGSNCVLSWRCTFTCQWFLVLLRCAVRRHLTLLPPYPVLSRRSSRGGWVTGRLSRTNRRAGSRKPTVVSGGRF